ncbi:MAG TPA: hypothetical protein VKU03_16150 [Roseiarcus sp.]|nr:hypothetical protein [Roseiarcus sp.]
MDETDDDQEKVQKIAPYPIVPSRKTASARCSVWRSTMGESLAVVAISDDTIDAPFDDLKPGKQSRLQCDAPSQPPVMPGLAPSIRARPQPQTLESVCSGAAWMAGTNPAMTHSDCAGRQRSRRPRVPSFPTALS